jgi:sugar phosphate isomerase/epimerase
MKQRKRFEVTGMLRIGTQTQNVVNDVNPIEGFELLKKTGFSCADFSLDIYMDFNGFFNKTDSELERFFTPHKLAARDAGITINQMHMPYPIYLPKADAEINDYLRNVVAPKSLKICKFFECKYIVVHGFKLARFLGSEDAEWERTLEFLEFLAPMTRELGITICIENLYNRVGGRLLEGPCCDVRKAVERIDRINDKFGAEVLGFCFDTGHANLIGLDFENFITTLDYRLKVLHIHDNDGIDDLHQIPFTFTKAREDASSTDWDGFIRGLKAVKFDKVLNFETAPVLTAFPDELKENVLSLIASIGKYMIKGLS